MSDSKVPSKGMRRVVHAGGALHLLGDGKRLVVQVRTPHLTSADDAAGAACKLGVEMNKAEAFKLLRSLVDLLAAME